MTLRNAFEDLATEATVSAVADQVATPAQSSNTIAQNIRGIFQALNILTRWLIVVPKTATNQIRTVVDTGSIYSSLYWGNQNNVPGWFTTGSPGAVDSRQQLGEAMKLSNLTRRQQWTFS